MEVSKISYFIDQKTKLDLMFVEMLVFNQFDLGKYYITGKK